MFDTRFAKSSDDETEEEAVRKQNNIAYQRSEVDRAPQSESLYLCMWLYLFYDIY